MSGPEPYQIPTGSRSARVGLFLGTAGAVLAAILVVIWLTTQWMAWKLDYDRQLAPELWIHVEGWSRIAFALLGLVCGIGVFRMEGRRRQIGLGTLGILALLLALIPIYQPLAFFWWALRFRHLESVAPLIQAGLWMISIPAHFLVVVSIVVEVRRARKESGPSDTHGSADFAELGDVRSAGLLSSEGIVLGGWKDGSRIRYLRRPGSQHCLVFAPSRSGKGSSVVIPTLLSWPDSVVVFDPKGENWHRTAGWRSQELGSCCIRINPVDRTGGAARWNPLLEIQRGPLEVRDAQQVAEILTSGEGGPEDPHWRTTAADLLTGVILHCLYVERDKTLSGVLELLSDPHRSVEATLQEMIEAEHDPTGSEGWVDRLSGQGTTTHPVVASVARAMLNRSENERSSVLSTAVRCLTLWRDFCVSKQESASDFAIADLVRGDRPVSIYVTVPIADLRRTRPFTRLFFALALRRLTEELEGDSAKNKRRRVLLVLDEFAELHHIPEFENALSVIAGFGIQALVVTQDLTQIYKHYGRNQAITGNCEVLVAFRTQNIDTAKLISEMAGTRTVRRQRNTYTGNRLSPWLGHVMTSEQESQRALLSPDEVMRLPDDATLVFAGGKPIHGVKTPYYQDVEYRRRSAIAPPVTSDRIPSARVNSWPQTSATRDDVGCVGASDVAEETGESATFPEA